MATVLCPGKCWIMVLRIHGSWSSQRGKTLPIKKGQSIAGRAGVVGEPELFPEGTNLPSVSVLKREWVFTRGAPGRAFPGKGRRTFLGKAGKQWQEGRAFFRDAGQR